MSTSENLIQSRCQPCEGLAQSLTAEEALKLHKQTPDWNITADNKGIFREYQIKNFIAAISFINTVADLAEADDHHPDIHLTGYRNLRIDLTTHALKGLSKNDFILAAKIDQLPLELKK